MHTGIVVDAHPSSGPSRTFHAETRPPDPPAQVPEEQRRDDPDHREDDAGHVECEEEGVPERPRADRAVIYIYIYIYIYICLHIYIYIWILPIIALLLLALLFISSRLLSSPKPTNVRAKISNIRTPCIRSVQVRAYDDRA